MDISVKRKLTLAGVLFLAQSAFAIHNGVDLKDSEYPAMFQVLTLKAGIQDDLKQVDDFCSGVAISDSILATAGHCVPDKREQAQGTIIAVHFENDKVMRTYRAIEFDTKFLKEPTPDMYSKVGSSPGYVEGCFKGPVPLIRTSEPDVALVYFPKGTFKHWLEIDETALIEGQEIQMYGFGARHDSAVQPILSPNLSPGALAVSKSKVWSRQNDQRFSVLNGAESSFADFGDSGGPVVRKGKLVGILSTREDMCETPMGEDFAILNSVTKVHAIKALLAERARSRK